MLFIFRFGVFAPIAVCDVVDFVFVCLFGCCGVAFDGAIWFLSCFYFFCSISFSFLSSAPFFAVLGSYPGPFIFLVGVSLSSNRCWILIVLFCFFLRLSVLVDLCALRRKPCEPRLEFVERACGVRTKRCLQILTAP